MQYANDFSKVNGSELDAKGERKVERFCTQGQSVTRHSVER